SKGQIEAAIRNAIIRFEMEFLGRGPTDVRAYILQDLIIVRLKGVLTPAEQQLAKNPEGVTLVKRMRSNLLDQGRDDLIKEISSLTGAEVVGLFTDVHVASGERVIVLTMDVNLEQRFLPAPTP
ncbi:MAG TPA: DUF2294 domain-containing protein, partial [Nitrospirales bacterium]|nr:DUF2294 domain-containing protein [Nitrospirales bacterium]